MLLSVCIPTLRERTSQRELLLRWLYGQAAPHPDVEVIILEDDRRVPYHRKLNNLVTVSSGDYICFVDDDDWVAEDYIDAIVDGLNASPGCDAMLYDTIYTIDGAEMKWVRYAPDNPVASRRNEFIRPVEQRQPVARRILEAVPYAPPDFGADIAWSVAVREAGLIRDVAAPVRRFPDQPMYHHRATTADRQGLWP